MGGSRGGAATHDEQQLHNGEKQTIVATAVPLSTPTAVLFLSRKKRIIEQSGLPQHFSSSCPPWLPLHASLALNFALVYYICLSLSPAAQQYSNGAVPSSRQQELGTWCLSNHEQQLHRASRNELFCNSTSFSRDPGTVQDCVCSPAAPVGSSHVSFSAVDHARECSSNGHFVVLDQQQQRELGKTGACHCHPCFAGPRCAELTTNCILNLSIGDPTVFESYWLALGSQATTVIPAWQGMSYFAHKHNAFLFLDHHLELAIRELHTLVGNAVTKGRYILLGVGSTQLFQAAIYALASPENSTKDSPIKIVSAVPFYSAYAEAVEYQKSAKYKWAGDASKFQPGGNFSGSDQQEAYIEVVTSPSNPEGSIRQAVLQGAHGSTIHDLAYYWPHYTPIIAPADNPVMLFTFSKITGHAGTRLGWAIVEDKRIASKMFEYIRVNTLGVSQDAQRRAFTLIRTIIDDQKQHDDNHHGEEEEEEEKEAATASDLHDDCSSSSSTQMASSQVEHCAAAAQRTSELGTLNHHHGAARNKNFADAQRIMPFFPYIQTLLEERWRRIVYVLEGNSLFSIPVYDEAFCTFLGKPFRPNPAFLWLKCTTNGQDCSKLLLKYGIATREGPSFGVSCAFVRLSLLDRDPLFYLLLHRLASIQQTDL